MRRIIIPKPRSTDKWPLTIPSPVDRIIHRSITNALENIYEPVFMPVSYGFRHSENTHSFPSFVGKKRSTFFIEVKSWHGIKRIVHADSVFTMSLSAGFILLCGCLMGMAPSFI